MNVSACVHASVRVYVSHSLPLYAGLQTVGPIRAAEKTKIFRETRMVFITYVGYIIMHNSNMIPGETSEMLTQLV